MGRPLLTALFVLALLSMAHCGDGFRQDELECEQAVAKLLTCCPGFDAYPVSCSYSEGCGSVTYPALGLADSQCITTATCDALRSGSVCARAQAALPVEETDGEPSSPAASPVCP